MARVKQKIRTFDLAKEMMQGTGWKPTPESELNGLELKLKQRILEELLDE